MQNQKTRYIKNICSHRGGYLHSHSNSLYHTIRHVHTEIIWEGSCWLCYRLLNQYTSAIYFICLLSLRHKTVIEEKPKEKITKHVNYTACQEICFNITTVLKIAISLIPIFNLAMGIYFKKSFERNRAGIFTEYIESIMILKYV